MNDHLYRVKMSGDFLMHYGIPGQKWGVRNGPPYPLNSDTLASSLYKAAKKKEPKITKDVTKAASIAGSKMHGLENRLKTKDSIKRKIETISSEDGEPISDAAKTIKDAVRYTTIQTDDRFVDSYIKTKNALVKAGYKETRCKNNWEAYKQGKVKHKSVQSIFEDPSGYSFEIQFHTPSSQNAKDKKLPLYEERRSLGISDGRARELERQMETLAKDISDPKGIEKIKSHG